MLMYCVQYYFEVEFNSTFRTISKATADKVTAKVVGSSELLLQCEALI